MWVKSTVLATSLMIGTSFALASPMIDDEENTEMHASGRGVGDAGAAGDKGPGSTSVQHEDRAILELSSNLNGLQYLKLATHQLMAASQWPGHEAPGSVQDAPGESTSGKWWKLPAPGMARGWIRIGNAQAF